LREYTIYWIEEEFAHYYFGREGMFYRLFAESNEAKGELESVLSMQVNYITKPIPSIQFNQFIKNEMKHRTSYRLTKEGHTVNVENGNSRACLSVAERNITLLTSGKYEAEMMFFELLKKWDPRFLAVDFTQTRFGWISPRKQRKFV
jgi:hypothetical protein